MNKEEKNNLIIEGTLSEMAGADDFTIQVPVAKGVDIKALTEGDPDPMFVVVEALNETVSKNNREYDTATIKSIAEQINNIKPDAYVGHIKDEERAYKNPQSKTIWIGAKVMKIDGKNRLFVKGYVLPYAKELKQYLKAAKAIGKQVAVSIYGLAREVLDPISKIKKVVDFRLESIDWARSGAAGVDTLGYMAITKEMEDDANKKDWLAVIDTYNTVRESVEESMRNETSAKHQTQLQVVSEMLGTTPENVVDTVMEMKNTLDRQEKELTINFIEEQLKGRVSSKSARSIIKTIVLAEMDKSVYNRTRASAIIDSVLQSDIGKQVLSEMSRKLDINPLVERELDSRSYTVIK